MPSSRGHLRRIYLRLGSGELVAAVVFAAVGAARIAPKLDRSARPVLWSVLAPLLAILVQAGIFWLLARSWVGVGHMSAPLAHLYVGFGVFDVLLLLTGLVLLVTATMAPWTRTALAAIWMFACVEFVNYFVVRLAYPAGSWFAEVSRWRTPQLISDIRAGMRART
ncbi:MAG: hypothetical protein QM589_13310 [Thermomicrobiales bacterium]